MSNASNISSLPATARAMRGHYRPDPRNDYQLLCRYLPSDSAKSARLELHRIDSFNGASRHHCYRYDIELGRLRTSGDSVPFLRIADFALPKALRGQGLARALWSIAYWTLPSPLRASEGPSRLWVGGSTSTVDQYGENMRRRDALWADLCGGPDHAAFSIYPSRNAPDTRHFRGVIHDPYTGPTLASCAPYRQPASPWHPGHPWDKYLPGSAL